MTNNSDGCGGGDGESAHRDQVRSDAVAFGQHGDEAALVYANASANQQ